MAPNQTWSWPVLLWSLLCLPFRSIFRNTPPQGMSELCDSGAMVERSQFLLPATKKPQMLWSPVKEKETGEVFGQCSVWFKVCVGVQTLICSCNTSSAHLLLCHSSCNVARAGQSLLIRQRVRNNRVGQRWDHSLRGLWEGYVPLWN